MDKKLIENADTCYRLAEQKAAQYFTTLHAQVRQKTYVPTLINDLHAWKQHHLHHSSFVSFFSRRRGKPVQKEYHSYIQWLNYTGQLNQYLDRSISYIFMRDLGKRLDSPANQTRIQQVVANLKKQLTDSKAKDQKEQDEAFSMVWLYRQAKKEGIESTMIWVVDKLKIVATHIPKGMDAEQAQRKLMKLIAGVLMHVIEEMDAGTSSEERRRKLDEAIRLGYSYGLTYPFIDDLLDAKILSAKEEKHYSDLIRTALMTGSVPELGEWTETNKDLLKFIHTELKEAFHYIKSHQRRETRQSFFEQAYVFFHSQEVDRLKNLTDAHYTNEELYIPIILKSFSSRFIVRSLINAPEDEEFEQQTFFYGIYNQLADDFSDMFDDLKDGAVTPYTYYIKYHDQRSDLINPFELYWTVIFNLLHHVYKSDAKTCEVIFDRAINSLKRFKERMGTKKYKEVMGIFASGHSEFYRLIQHLVQKANHVDFFDKLLRDQMISNLKRERKEQENFLATVKAVRTQINQNLVISKLDHAPSLEESIVDAANYSLEGDGKRLRPVITWVMGVEEYGLDEAAILPLLRSLEYMHTASLIFDDLPSQDNASIRRGRPTLHQTYNIATAELTGLFLTQKAIEEQTLLTAFDSNAVLDLVRYSAQVTAEMCKGQALDLASKGKRLTMEQLNQLSFYKTGIAFEASLMMPAILARAKKAEIEALKTFAYHAGIAFQIKDDLLDVEGVESKLGKSIGKDAENKNSTFVSILGAAEAKKAMWEHYCLAMDTLQEVPRNTTFLKHLLNYMINRDH